MGRMTLWTLIALLVSAASAQEFQVLDNNVVDKDFNVIGQLEPGETLQQFIRRYAQENPGSVPVSDSPVASPARLSSFEPLGLSSGATKVLGTVAVTFSCEGLPYGYYADPNNACRVYHVCNPISSSRTLQYSFFCNTGSVFDQRLLTCVLDDGQRAEDCANVDRLYESSNSQFFRQGEFRPQDGLVTRPGSGQVTGAEPVVLVGVTGGVPVTTETSIVVDPLAVGSDSAFDGAGLLDVRFGRGFGRDA